MRGTLRAEEHMKRNVEAEPGALDGVTVVDCSNLTAGPTTSMILGDFGAEVIKVELPGSGDPQRTQGARKNGQGVHWKYISRNKKLITLALNKSEGQALFLRVMEVMQPDVMIEAFRPGTLERWNLGYERLKCINPGLVLVRISGFGQTGPYRQRPGFGTLAEAMSGFAHLTGEPEGPPTLPPFAMADQIAALLATIGVLLALRARERNGGIGQVIDTALVEGVFSLFNTQLIEYDQLGINPRRMGSRVVSSAPRNLYRAADGKYVAISAPVQSIVSRLFTLMDMPQLIHDDRFSSNEARLRNVDELDCIVGEWIAKRTQEQALALLVDADVSAAPVMDIADLYENEHVRARDATVAVPDCDFGSVVMHAPLPRLSRTPGHIRHTGRTEVGADNDEIYRKRLGLSAEELLEFQQKAIV
jgi:formyl-CoA transferase